MYCDKSKNILRLTAAALFTALIVILLNTPDSNAGNSFSENIRFNFGAGLSNYNMERAQVQIVPPDKYIYYNSHFKKIEGGREYFGEIAFIYSRNISFGPGILYSGGERDLTEWRKEIMGYPNLPRPLPQIYKVSLIAPYLKASYISTIDVLNISINGSLYYGFGTLKADVRTYIPPYVYRSFTYKSRGTGYSISFGLSFEMTEGIAIENRFGYRNLVTGKLKGQGGNELENSSLNFDGYFIRAGVSFNPWDL